MTCLIFLLITLLPSAQATTLDANTLIRALARPVPAITHYREVRFIGLLKAPLVLQGTLEYHGNEQLLKQVDTPYHETTRITGTEVEVARAGKSTRRFSLKHAPELEGFLASFSALLAGDMARLEKFYTLSISGDTPLWQLMLTPNANALTQRIRNIEIIGAHSTLRCFIAHETDGDSSVLLVEDLANTPLPQPLAFASLHRLCEGTSQ